MKVSAVISILVCFALTSVRANGPEVKFIENRNQFADYVHLAARIPGGTMQLRAGGFHYFFLNTDAAHRHHHHGEDGQETASSMRSGVLNGHYISAEFIGANRESVPIPFGKSEEYYNYFIGKDMCRWASGVHAYMGVYYPAYYSGIDLKVYGQGQQVKYDFLVAPSADPTQIQFTYTGADDVHLGEHGDLQVHTAVGEITEGKPVAYQWIAGEKVFVKCRYLLQGNTVSFVFPNGYDACYPLVIDPLLIFSTYSGSTADNWGSTATPGERGTLYSAGVTNEQVGGFFPATPGAFQVSSGNLYDIGILKYDSAGTRLLYASYLGGDRNESPHSLIVNSKNELILLGTSGSSNFPVSAGAVQKQFAGGVTETNTIQYSNGSDIVVARISPDGKAIMAATYLGGSLNDGLNPSGGILTKNYGDQMRGDVITDVGDHIYISSVTASSDFPTTNTYFGGATDALLLKLDPDLSGLEISRFIGGAGTDAAHTIKLGAGNTIYTAGGTSSFDFPIIANAYQPSLAGDADGWIAHLSSDGVSVLQSTYTGTTDFDQVYFLDLNSSEEVYVYGQTNGPMLVTPSTVYSNPNSGQFVQKFSTDLTSLNFSTVIGSGRGAPDISPTAFLVSECNTIYLAGWGGRTNWTNGGWSTSSTFGLPLTPEALQSTTSGNDLYFMVLADDATTFLYGTYFGGAQSSTHVDGGTSRFDKNGLVYHAVCASCGGFDRDFTTTPNAKSRTNNSNNCNNLAFKLDLASLTARIQTNSVALDMPGLSRVCLPDKIVFQNKSSGGESFEWLFGDGTKTVKTDTNRIVYAYAAPGRYKVWLKAVDKGTCKVKDSVSVLVDVFDVDGSAQENDALCAGDAYSLQASGGIRYEWWTADNSFQSTQQNPTVIPSVDTEYYVQITEDNGCFVNDTVSLKVTPRIDVSFELTKRSDCFSTPEFTVTNTTGQLLLTDLMFFDFGDGTTDDQTQVTHRYKEEGAYNVKLVGVRSTDGDEVCVNEKVVEVQAYSIFVPNVITPAASKGLNDTFVVQYGAVSGVSPFDLGVNVKLKIVNRWGDLVYESNDYRNDFSGEGLSPGVYYYEVTVQDNATCRSWIQIIKGNE